MDWGINSVSTREQHKPTIIQYWTKRYVLTLCIGLIIIGLLLFLWMRHNALLNRMEILQYIAEETAERLEGGNPNINFGLIIEDIFEKRRQFIEMGQDVRIIVADRNGRIVTTRPKNPLLEQKRIPRNLLVEEDGRKLELLNRSHFIVKEPIERNERVIGWVIVAQPKGTLLNLEDDLVPLFILLGSLGILGWGVIYFLTKRLSRPIQLVSEGAKKIREGNYDVKLPQNIQEKEVFELVDSFQEMSSRLKQLEKLRIELLAGVTHELKTPVTSMSGLIQAVKDEVVIGDEAKEFMDISLKEAGRMQQMVNDLLDFNSFATGKVMMSIDILNINEWLEVVSNEYEILYPDIKIDFQPSSTELFCEYDPARLQQVVLNLWNNARQAMNGKGTIWVTVIDKGQSVQIDVKDEGPGIPKEEVEHIFERFYRGKEKKERVRGLGLGLPLSQMLALAMGGDLFLKHTSPHGTTFSIVLRKKNPKERNF